MHFMFPFMKQLILWCKCDIKRSIFSTVLLSPSLKNQNKTSILKSDANKPPRMSSANSIQELCVNLPETKYSM